MKKWFIIFVLLTSFSILCRAQNQITVEWIYDRERIDQYAIPDFHWLKNGNLILLNKRVPADRRTFKIYLPQSNKLSDFLDMEKAVQSLLKFTGDDSIQTLDWPLDIDSNGRFAIYRFSKDLFLLDFNTAEFKKITDTPEPEKAPRFSPDGNYITYVYKNNIYIYDVIKDTVKQLTSDGSETLLNGTLSWVYWEEIFGRKDIAYWWSFNSKYLVFLKTGETDVGVMHFVDFKPQTPRVIRQPYPKAGTKNPTVTVNIFDMDKNRIYPVEFADHLYEYLIRVQWSPDNKIIALQTMNRAQTEVNLFFCSPNGRSLRHILTERDTAWVNIHDDLTFLPGEQQFLWTSERDGYAHIYRYTSDGNLINRVTKGEWSLRSSGGRYWLRQSVMGFDNITGYIYFVSQEKSPLERHLYRIKPDGTGMERLTEQSGTHRISMSPAFDYYMDTYSNSTTPPALSCCKTGTKSSQEIIKSKKTDLRSFNVQFPVTFKISASDGFQLPAQILKPADFNKNKKYPLIIYVYGGPSAPTVSNAWRTDIYFENILLRNGYLVARADPRSAAAISKTLENSISGRMSGPLELKDLLDAVTWFKSQSYIDENRVGIWGWSGGGSFTLNAMTNSDAFKAGISVAPVTDWHYYDSKWAESGMKKPSDNPEGYKVTSCVLSAPNLHGRLLLVHGTYDDNVHPQNSWAFINELIKAGKMFDMMFYPMRKHGISDLPARRHLYHTMLAFWNRNL